MELKHTSAWMESDDYRKRFLAEYHQTKIRYDGGLRYEQDRRGGGAGPVYGGG